MKIEYLQGNKSVRIEAENKSDAFKIGKLAGKLKPNFTDMAVTATAEWDLRAIVDLLME